MSVFFVFFEIFLQWWQFIGRARDAKNKSASQLCVHLVCVFINWALNELEEKNGRNTHIKRRGEKSETASTTPGNNIGTSSNDYFQAHRNTQTKQERTSNGNKKSLNKNNISPNVQSSIRAQLPTIPIIIQLTANLSIRLLFSSNSINTELLNVNNLHMIRYLQDLLKSLLANIVDARASLSTAPFSMEIVVIDTPTPVTLPQINYSMADIIGHLLQIYIQI